MSRKNRLAVVLAALVVGATSLVALSLTAPPAHADTQTTKSNIYRQGYVSTVTTRFYSPNICVRTKFLGVISFRANVRTWKRSIENDTLYLYWIDQARLSNNTLTVTTFKPNGSSCTSTPKNYLRLSAKLKARGYSCKWSQSISVGVPWQASYSFWPDCGNRELAGWSAKDENGGHYFKMSKTNDVVKFTGSQETNWSPTKRSNLTWGCLGVAADLTPKTGTAVDTKTTKKIKICPTWNGTTRAW
ncbi:hypothetical protein [Nocardioides sp. LML1-1-1.1]|uniref:hypothetical protein n=1 Tax=Nocardioides sp. LML1-1-1.1 TaxID=3135248 RepID=UPI0034472A6A